MLMYIGTVFSSYGSLLRGFCIGCIKLDASKHFRGPYEVTVLLKIVMELWWLLPTRLSHPWAEPS